MAAHGAQERPRRYEYSLTVRGHDLLPVVRAVIKWGQAHVPGTAKRPAADLVVRLAPRPTSRRPRRARRAV